MGLNGRGLDMMFAQVDPVAAQIWSGIIGSAVTAGCGGLVYVLNAWWRNKRTGRADSLKEWQDAAAMHKKDGDDCRQLLRVQAYRSSVLESRALRAESRIESLEDALRRADIPFRPYVPADTPEYHQPEGDTP